MSAIHAGWRRDPCSSQRRPSTVLWPRLTRPSASGANSSPMALAWRSNFGKAASRTSWPAAVEAGTEDEQRLHVPARADRQDGDPHRGPALTAHAVAIAY